MRRVNQLSKSELVFYSKVILAIQIALISDPKLHLGVIVENGNTRYLQFPVLVGYSTIFVIYDRTGKTFRYSDILIPNGVFDETINYL